MSQCDIAVEGLNMSRGRRALPDEVKAIKGNPGRRRLAMEHAGMGELRGKPVAFVIPEFLTHQREIDLFRRVVEDYLQRRVARAPDLTAYARWASYLDEWISCKEYFDQKDEQGRPRSRWYRIESKHGTRLARHPRFKDQLDMEKLLQSLEDRLGLNPISRQNIMKGLSAMPAALGELFGDDPPHDEKPEHEIPSTEEVAEVSALGFLQAAGKPH